MTVADGATAEGGLDRLDATLTRIERPLVAAMLALGFVVRIVWLFLAPAERLGPHKSEMWHVAATFAETGRLADAYAPGSGVSSHVGPFNTVVEGLIYRAFGVGTLPSELILAVLAAAVVGALFWLLYRVAAELGIAVVPRLAALGFLLFVPLNFYVEVVDFRIREGAFAAMLAAGLLWWLLRLDAAGSLGLRSIARFGLAAGFAFLINPGIALPAYAGLGLVGLRHLPVRRWPLAAVVLALGFVAVNGAWIVRNEVVYHRFMVSRGNFGLELDTANHAAAVDPTDPRAVFVARSQEIHPFFSATALARLKTFPDDATYFATLGAEANAWIAAHPGDFARITLRHLRELYFPPQWLFDQYGTGRVRDIGARQAIVWAVSALGLLGLALGLAIRARQYLFVALTIAFPTLLYIVVQPTLRYRYAFAGLLTYLAAGLVWRVISPRARSPR
jgi:hypothetical protein